MLQDSAFYPAAKEVICNIRWAFYSMQLNEFP